MLQYIHDQTGSLTVSTFTTAFSGNKSPAITAYARELKEPVLRAGAFVDHGTDHCAIANEIVLYFTKVQGSTDEIQIQVTESDTEAFTLENIVQIRGALYFTITSSTFADSALYRLDPIPIRCKYVKVAARYSGGSATSATMTVYHKLFHNEQLSTGAVAVVGGATGMAADVKQIDRVAYEGLAYSASYTVSGGTYAADVITFTITGHPYVANDIVTVSGCGTAHYDGVYTVVTAATDEITVAHTGDPGAWTTNGSALQAQATTRLVDESASWTASQWSTLGAYVEITSGTGARQKAPITSNGTHWIAFAAMTTAPVTSDSSYSIIETGVNALVCDTELNLTVGDITVNSIEAYKYRSTEPDIAAGQSAQGSCDIKGNVRVAGAEAHGAGVARSPVLSAGYASAVAQTAVDAGDVCRFWTTLNGATVIAGRNQDGTTSDVSTAIDVGTDNAACTTLGLVRIGGIARAKGSTTAYAEEDSCMATFDLTGGLRVGGSCAIGVAAQGNPLLCGGKASDVALTAVDANDAQPAWLSLNGAVVGAGLYQHATANLAISMPLPVTKDHAIMFQTNATLLPMGAMYLSTAPTYDNYDAASLQVNVHGALITTGAVGESDLSHGQQTVATPGTEVAVGGDLAILDGQRMYIKAKMNNTGMIYVGDSDVTSADGLILFPGEGVSLAVTNTNIPYIDADVAGEGVSWIVERS